MGTLHEPTMYMLSQHSSNPLQVPSDDSMNAAYVETLRPLLNAEKARAAQGLPPRTSSTPSARLSISDGAEEDEYAAGDITLRPSASAQDDVMELGFDQSNNLEYSQSALGAYGVTDEDDDGVLIHIENHAQGTEEYEDSALGATMIEDEDEEEELVEEDSLMKRPREEREQIMAEMRDLERAVPRILRDYRLLDRLGEGTFSTVYKAIDITYEDEDYTHPMHAARGYVAIKRIYVTSSPQRIANELSILEDCRDCRNVSKLLTAFRHRDQVVAIMPFVPNRDFREVFPVMSLTSVRAYFRCLFRALSDIHALGIVHRDVKPANFLFDPTTNEGVLCDFGLAQRLDHEPSSHGCLHTAGTKTHPHGRYRNIPTAHRNRLVERTQEARRRTSMASDRIGVPADDVRPALKANRAGTRGFRAPEVLLKCTEQSVAIDIWSAGVILMCILACRFPIFVAGDDVEALMELAAVYGRKTMEKCAKLHNRLFSTNVLSVEHDEMSWGELVHRINPHLYQLDASSPRPESAPLSPRKQRLNASRFARSASPPPPSHPHSRKSKAVPSLIPSSPIGPSSNTNSSSSVPLPRTIPQTKHNTRIDQAIDLMEQCLHWDATKRITASDALMHPFLLDLLVEEDEDMDAEGEEDGEADAEGEVDIEVDGEGEEWEGEYE